MSDCGFDVSTAPSLAITGESFIPTAAGPSPRSPPPGVPCWPDIPPARDNGCFLQWVPARHPDAQDQPKANEFSAAVERNHAATPR